MTMLSPMNRNRSEVAVRGRLIQIEWRTPSPAPHEFVAVACPEDDDSGYSVFALNYPDVISQGETLDEAKANIAEAFLAVLESRRKHGEDMRFSQIPSIDIPVDCERFRISVDG